VNLGPVTILQEWLVQGKYITLTLKILLTQLNQIARIIR
jgi:hypothetical protein